MQVPAPPSSKAPPPPPHPPAAAPARHRPEAQSFYCLVPHDRAAGPLSPFLPPLAGERPQAAPPLWRTPSVRLRRHPRRDTRRHLSPPPGRIPPARGPRPLPLALPRPLCHRPPHLPRLAICL